jgi:hypothetical protein
MVKAKILILAIILFIFKNLSAQVINIFVPGEIKNAIKNQTRTTTGVPGPNYWQNSVDYKIEVSFDAETGKLVGKQNIVYVNNSPNTLYNIVFNIYPNLFKKGNARDREVNPLDVNDGLIVSKISIDGKPIDLKSKNINFDGTHMDLGLQKPLAQKAKVSIVMEWSFTMPNNTTIRVGKYGTNSWFVGYWYPQIAVYDDIFGWDEVNYDGLHEFYSPFANFDVKITIPASQVVWATGIWQNPGEILNEPFLGRYNEALSSETAVNIVTEEDLNQKITKSEKENTWHFVAQNVPDFSFATADKYLWDGISITTDKKLNKKTFIQTAYNKTSRDFLEVADIAKKTINYLSTVMPAVPFPYPRMTVFNGDDGMEFPMMVNDRSEMFKSATVNLTSHEISHTYFPFYMGINQARYSWMDEGWAQFLPAEFQDKEVSGNSQVSFSASNYSRYAGTSNEMPMMVPSYFLKGYEYYITSYYRPELAYRVLQNLLGRDLFLKGMQEYIRRWNGKYPSPYDFFFTFNEVTKQDLSWYWKPWFFEIAYPDLAINSIEKVQKDYVIEIENLGGLPIPIEINLEFSDASKDTISRTADVWKDGNKKYQLKYSTDKTISHCLLGASWIPDIDKSNNKK